jgi:uncharacterized protein YbjT (DUF2867 family)
MQMKIIVTGSLGHISKPLTHQLLQQDHAVTVISSNPEKYKEISDLGARPAIGSVEDITFLQNTFSTADAVYCMTPPNFSKPDQVEYYRKIADCYAKAIEHSSIKRVVYLSSYGAHLPAGTGFITGSYKAEKLLDLIPGINLTHMRPTFFYYNLFGFIHMIKSEGYMGAVYGGEDKLAMVSPADIATAVAKEITQPDSNNKVCYVTSDDRICHEVASVLGTAIGIPDLEWRILPAEQVMRSLLANGIPQNAAMNIVELGMATHQGILREDFDRSKQNFGEIRMEDFAKEFAIAYNQ